MKVMFICTGNICRSAMAEWMLRKKEEENEKQIEIYSAGLSADTGEYSTDNAIEVMKEYDVDLLKHRATNIHDSNIENMDLILCATENHKRYVMQMFPKLKKKTYTLKEYCFPGLKDIDIKDPWGLDRTIYKNCAEEINRCLDELVKKI